MLLHLIPDLPRSCIAKCNVKRRDDANDDLDGTHHARMVLPVAGVHPTPSNEASGSDSFQLDVLFVYIDIYTHAWPGGKRSTYIKVYQIIHQKVTYNYISIATKTNLLIIEHHVFE